MANIPYISPELLKSYHQEISTQASAATSKRKMASLKKFFGWAKKEGHIQENPIEAMAPLPQPPKNQTPKRPHKVSNVVKIGALVGMVVLILLLVGRVKIPIPFRLAPAGEPTASLFPTASPTPTQVAPSPTPAPSILQEVDPIFSKIYKDGVLTLEGAAPALKAIGGLLIEASSLVLKTEDNTDGDIEIAPDGNGIAHFLFEGTGENFLNAQAPNLNSGSLYYGIVANNSTGYNLLKLQSGSTPTTRFSVDALGNTYLGGNITIGNNLIIGGATRFTNLGRLTSITGYYQNSGIFEIDQGGPDYVDITKSGVTATADSVNFTLDETGQTASNYDTLVLSRLNGGSDAFALHVDDGNTLFDGYARFDGQLQLGRFGANPGAIGEGSIVYNTTDDLIYFWNGTVWSVVGGGTLNFANITSGTNTTAAMVVGTGASLTYSGGGTITASDLTCVDCLDFTEFSDTMTLDGATDIALGALTLSTSGTGALDFNSTGQVSFAGNVNAEDGLDVTGDNLSVGGANFSVDVTNGNIVTAGDIAVNGDTITSDGELTIDATSKVIIPDADTLESNDLTSAGALTLTSTGANDLTLDSGSGLVYLNTDDDLLPTLGAADADLGALLTPWDNIYGLAIYQNGSQVCDSTGTGCPDPTFDDVYANSAAAFNLDMEIDDANGLTFNMTTTGDFLIRDNGANLVNFGDDSVINFTPANATVASGRVLINGATVDSTTDSGLLDINIDTAAQGASGASMDFELVDAASNITAYAHRTDVVIDNDAAQSHTIYGNYVSLDNDDASSSLYGFYAVNADDAVAAAGSVTALVGLANADANEAVTNGILFEAGGANVPDFTTGINFDAADFTTEIVLENAETISNQTNGTIALGADAGAVTLSLSGTAATVSNTAGNLTINSAANLDIDDAVIDVSTQTTDIEIIDANATAFTISQAANYYINIDTTNTAEKITLGNATNADTSVEVTKGATGNIILTGFDCNTLYTNGGALTTDASGNVICSDDADGGVASSVSWEDITDPTTSNLVLAMSAYTTTMGWTATGALNAWTMNLVNNAGAATTQNFVTIKNDVTTQTNDVNTEALLVLDNADTSGTGLTKVNDALLITNSGAISSGITDAIDASDTEIVNAINVGPNIILGTGATIDFTEFDVSGGTGEITINDDGDAGKITIEGTVLDINSLDFFGAGSITSATTNTISLDSGTTGAVNIGTGVNDKTITIGNASTNTSVVLTKGASGNITLTGFDCTGNTNGGALTADASGNITCSDDDKGITSVAWHEIGDPTDNQTLTMGAFTTVMDWTATGALSPWTMNLVNNAGAATTQNFVTITNAVTTQTNDVNTEALLVLDNADTSGTGETKVDNALLVTNSGGIAAGITDAIDVSASDIVNAINVGPNIILGTGATIDFTEFDVAGATGSITIDDDGNAGQVSVEGTVLNGSSLTFVGAGTLASAGGATLTIDSADGSVTFAEDDDLIPTLGVSDADIGAALIRWDNIYAVAGDFSGTVTVNDLTCTDCLDFTEFSDTMSLDGDVSIAAGAGEELTYNKTYTDGTGENGMVLNFTASDTGAGTTSQYGLYLDNVASTEGLDASLVIDNSDADDAVAAGILFADAGGGFTNLIDSAEFDVSGGTGEITINDGGDAGKITIEGTVLDINSLDFFGAGSITSATTNTISLDSGTTGAVNIGTGVNDKTITIGNASTNTSVVLTKGASGNITLTGFDCTGNTNGGALTTDASGNISCSDDEDSGGSVSLDAAYNNGGTITVDAYDVLFNLNDDTNDYKFTIDNTTSGDIATAMAITTTGASSSFATAIDVSDADIVNAISVGDNTILGTAAVIDFTDFDVDADGLMTFASDGAGDQITITSPAADFQALVVDASTADSTQTAGMIDLNVDTVTDTAIGGLALDLNVKDAAGNLTVYGNKTSVIVDTDADQSHTVYGEYIGMDNDDATSTVYGLYIDADTDSGGEGTEYAAVFLDGNVGIGNNAPTTQLHIGSAAETHPLSTDDVLIGSDLEVDGILYLDGGQIAGTYGPGTVHINLTSTPVTVNNTLGLTSYLVQNEVNVGMAALMVDQKMDNRDIFTASADGTTKFTIAYDGVTTIRPGDASGVVMLVVGDGTGKINVGTVDPVYNIGGTKYATYMAGMVGVKEETAGNANIAEYVPGVGYRHLIDFKTLDNGSDLWLFSKATDLRNNLDKMVVLLTPSDNTKTWYTLDKNNYTLSIYSLKPTSVSYRLTAPRFDYALWSNYNHDDGTDGFYIPDEEISLNPNGEITPDPTVSWQDFSLTPTPSGYELRDKIGQVITGFEAFANLIAANIKAGAIETRYLMADTLEATTATVDHLLVESGLVSPAIKTALISPLAEESNVKVEIGKTLEDGTSGFGELIIQDATGSAVASVDTSGNAEFSGQVESNSLEVASEATIGGTLYADKIKSTTLDDIEAVLRQVEEDQSLLKQAANWDTNTASTSATLSYQELAVGNLFVTDTLAASSLSLADSLTLGSDMVISSNSINTLSSPLSLQSLAMAPIELMAGKVKIETNGDVVISGNLYVAGKVESTGLDIKSTLGETPAASINASGSADFSSVTADDLFIASSQTSDTSSIVNGEIQTNATVGQAIIPAGTSELTIRNPKITDYTLVYVTPTSSTSNQVLYIKSKSAGYFSVGFSNPLETDVSFNWWVIQTASPQ